MLCWCYAITNQGLLFSLTSLGIANQPQFQRCIFPCAPVAAARVQHYYHHCAMALTDNLNLACIDLVNIDAHAKSPWNSSGSSPFENSYRISASSTVINHLYSGRQELMWIFHQITTTKHQFPKDMRPRYAWMLHLLLEHRSGLWR